MNAFAGDAYGKEELKQQAKARKNRDKKRKRRLKRDPASDEMKKLRRSHVDSAVVEECLSIDVGNLKHSKAGYIGIPDRGLEFKFLSGPAGRRLRRLLRRKYKILYFERTRYVAGALFD